MKSEFIDHATQSHETIAKIVGVEKGETTFTRPVPPAAIAAFWGTSDPQVDDPFAPKEAAQADADQGQDLGSASAVFYGVD